MVARAKAELPPPRPLKADPSCKRCVLHQRSKTVCCEGSGPLSAPIWLFGEALGANEEEVGRPFVGDAGRKLNYCLERADLRRKQVRIENIVRCRPPGNKQPSRRSIEGCWGYSLYLILKYKPKVIVAMGATAINTLMEPRGARGRKVDAWRGFYERRTFRWVSPKTGTVLEHTCWIVPTCHPSLCLRKWEYDDLLVFDLLEAKELAEGREPLSYPDTKVRVLKTKHEAIAFLRHLRRVAGFVCDVEDTRLLVHKTIVMCLGFCYKAGESTILPLHLQGDPPVPAWKPDELREILAELATTLEQSTLYGQNIKYDVQRFRKLTGIVDYDIGFDTMLAHHVLDENKPHNLTFLCQWFLGWHKYDAAIDPYKDGKVVRMWLVPDSVRHNYCGYDCDGTFRVRAALLPMLEEEAVENVYKIEHDLILPLADMEYRGIHLSKPRIVELAERYRKQAAKALGLVRKIAVKVLGPKGAGFNPGSAAQLAALLSQCGAKLRKRTSGGGVSVDKFVLAALALQKGRPGAVARAILNYRKVEKYVSTYLDGDTVAKREKEGALDERFQKRVQKAIEAGKKPPKQKARKEEVGGWLQWVESGDRVHTNYNQAVARTGRLSADDPPVQTAPRTGDIRSIVVPDDPRIHVLMSADYQKVELCVAAWLSNDETMVREILDGTDLHTKMAITARLMRNPTEQEWASFLELEKRLKAGEEVQATSLTTPQSRLLKAISARWAGSTLVAPLVSKDERAIAKGVNFGVLYGRGSGAIAEANPQAFPLGMAMAKRRERVQRVIDAFFDKYQGIAIYREDIVEKVHKQGYLRTTINGRVRRLYGMDWFESKWSKECEQRDYDLSHLEREALNSEIQSEGSADPLSQATRRVYDGIKRHPMPGFRMVLTLHDGMIFNVHREWVAKADRRIHEWMETTLHRDKKHRYEMPLKIDTTVEDYWGQKDS